MCLIRKYNYKELDGILANNVNAQTRLVFVSPIKKLIKTTCKSA